MQNLNIEETIQKNRKTKLEIKKKKKEESITNGKSNGNTDMQEKVNNVTTTEDVAKLVLEFEQIIKNGKSDIIWLTYHQGQIFQKFKEKWWFASMVLQFCVSKLTRVFRIAFFKLINNYPEIKNSSLSLHYFKRYLKAIREICKEKTSVFN